MSLRDPQICSQTHPLKSVFILTVLVLQVIDLGLKMLESLMKLEDGFSEVLGVQLVVAGELLDHEVVGVESTLHHPLAKEHLLLHRLKPGVHASGLLRSLNIPDVKQPITHLDGLRVLHHPREVGVDDLLEELVLGGAWCSHGDLDLSEKQQERRTEDFSAIRRLTGSGSI